MGDDSKFAAAAAAAAAADVQLARLALESLLGHSRRYITLGQKRGAAKVGHIMIKTIETATVTTPAAKYRTHRQKFASRIENDSGSAIFLVGLPLATADLTTACARGGPPPVRRSAVDFCVIKSCLVRLCVR